MLVAVAATLLAPEADSYSEAGIPQLLDFVKPKYSRNDPEGEGWFRLRVDPKSGRVLSASVVRSTGFAVLDSAAIWALRRWWFHPGASKSLVVPIQFSHRPPLGRGWHQIPAARSRLP